MQIELIEDQYVIRDNGANIQRIRALPARRWDGLTKRWYVPAVRESWDAMVAAKFPMQQLGLSRPDRSAYRIARFHGEQLLCVYTLGTPDDILRCKRIPENRQYSTKWQCWLCKPTRGNVQYLEKNFPQAEWEGSAEHLRDAVRSWAPPPRPAVTEKAKAKKAVLVEKGQAWVEDYKFKADPPPFKQQVTGFLMSRDEPGFALLMEQRTGKTRIIIDSAAYQYQQGQITGLLVFCPNGVKDVWDEQLAEFCPPEIPLDVFVWEPRTRHKAEGWVLSVPPGSRSLRVLIMNVEAMSGDIGSGIAELFLAKHTAMAVVDESTRIKSISAARTRRIIKAGKKAKFRRIMTGTPVTQGPLDVFAQFQFLGDRLLGFGSFYAFRNRYALMGGWQGKQVVGYANLEELQAKIDAYSYRVLRKDVYEELPEMTYLKREVQLTPEQARLYQQMAEEMRAELASGEKVEVMHAIVKVMRMQQIIGGFLPLESDDEAARTPAKTMPLPGKNPKLEELFEVIEDYPDENKIIIWAKFRAELALIAKALRERYGQEAVVEFHGGTVRTRDEDKRRFQNVSSGVKFFVGQPGAGGLGLDLSVAGLMIYYSNDHSLETRLQSQDRNQGPKQKAKKLLIVDLVAKLGSKKTSDYRLVTALRSKKSLADLITGDPTMTWI